MGRFWRTLAWFQTFENEKFWGGFLLQLAKKKELRSSCPGPTTAPQWSSICYLVLNRCAQEDTSNLGLFKGVYRCDYFRFRRCSDGCLKVRLQTKHMHLWTLTPVEIMLKAVYVHDSAGVTSSPCKSQHATPRKSEPERFLNFMMSSAPSAQGCILSREKHTVYMM